MTPATKYLTVSRRNRCYLRKRLTALRARLTFYRRYVGTADTDTARDLEARIALCERRLREETT